MQHKKIMDIAGKLQFVFGPNESFFFDSPKSWKWMNLPYGMEEKFNRGISGERAIQQPYGVALGTRGSWIVAFTAVNGSNEALGTSFLLCHLDVYVPEEP